MQNQQILHWSERILTSYINCNEITTNILLTILYWHFKLPCSWYFVLFTLDNLSIMLMVIFLEFRTFVLRKRGWFCSKHIKKMPGTVRNCSKLPETARNYSKLHGSVRNCPNLLETARKCSKLPESVRNCPKGFEMRKSARNAKKCSKLPESCQSEAKLLEIHRSW